MRNKKTITTLVVVGLLAIALLTVMLTTTKDVYSRTCTYCDGYGDIEVTCRDWYTRECKACDGYGYTECEGGFAFNCSACNGTGKCPGTPRKNNTYTWTCTECGNKEALGTQWICDLCLCIGDGYYCEKCGYTSNTDFHATQICRTCEGSGLTKYPCEHDEIEPHQVECEECEGYGDILYPCPHGYTEDHTIYETCPECDGLGHIHSGATHSNGGRCEDCGIRYELHEQSSTIDSYRQTSSGHTPIYSCTYPGCSGTYTGTTQAHTGGTHTNGGKCTICDYVYQTHSQSSNVERYTQTATTHTPIYSCTHSGCTETYTGTAESHTGGTHANGGKCTTCQYVYQTHSQSANITDYIKTATGHTAIYSCTHPGCTTTYTGTEQPHTYQDGICTVCGRRQDAEDCTHTNTEYKTTATEHWRQCKDCGEEISGTRGAHTGGTHANGGKCIACQYIYQTHSQSSNVVRYIKTATGHTAIYSCTQLGCTTTYTGTEQPHTYQDGVCTVCGRQQDAEDCTHENREWRTNSTQHWQICSDCREEIEGTREAHSYEDGICTDCGRQEQAQDCEHEHREWHSNATEHWQECTDCGEEIEGTRENHSYEDGICTDCGRQEQAEDCKHEHREWHSNATEHWQECTDCGKEIEGTREPHSYKDGNCTDCGKEDQEEECTHEHREWKANDTEHWQVCTDCGEEIEGTREKHSSQNGACIDCGLKDNTTTGGKDIPFTGEKTFIWIPITVLALLTVYGAVELRKYKNVK